MDLLNHMSYIRNDYKLVFHIIYHSNFSMPLIHQTRKAKSYFMRLQLLVSKEKKKFERHSCKAKVPQLRKFFVDHVKNVVVKSVSIDHCKSAITQRTYFKSLGNLKCSENVIYLFTCKACSKQYTGST